MEAQRLKREEDRINRLEAEEVSQFPQRAQPLKTPSTRILLLTI